MRMTANATKEYTPPAAPHCAKCDTDRTTRLYRDTYGLIAVLGWCHCLDPHEGRIIYREWQALPLTDPAYATAPKMGTVPVYCGGEEVALTPRESCQRCGFPVLTTARKKPGMAFWDNGAGLCGCAKSSYENINQEWASFRQRFPELVRVLREHDGGQVGEKLASMQEVLGMENKAVSGGMVEGAHITPAQGVENPAEGLFDAINTPSGGDTGTDNPLFQQVDEEGMF